MFAGDTVILGSEDLSDEQLHDEALLLAIRMREGVPKNLLSDVQIAKFEEYVASEDLIQEKEAFVLTTKGRLLADLIVREALS